MWERQVAWQVVAEAAHGFGEVFANGITDDEYPRRHRNLNHWARPVRQMFRAVPTGADLGEQGIHLGVAVGSLSSQEPWADWDYQWKPQMRRVWKSAAPLTFVSCTRGEIVAKNPPLRKETFGPA